MLRSRLRTAGWELVENSCLSFSIDSARPIAARRDNTVAWDSDSQLLVTSLRFTAAPSVLTVQARDKEALLRSRYLCWIPKLGLPMILRQKGAGSRSKLFLVSMCLLLMMT